MYAAIFIFAVSSVSEQRPQDPYKVDPIARHSDVEIIAHGYTAHLPQGCFSLLYLASESYPWQMSWGYAWS